MDQEKLLLLPLKSSKEMANKVNGYLQYWHKEDNSFIVDADCPRFGTGEAKGLIKQSIRDSDLYILVDVLNYSITYNMFGSSQRMSPDDHYQDLKRIITACNGKTEKITVIMPFLYESRQHRRAARESLDCALMLNELAQMGVSDIITFDAHDPRVQNSIPCHSLENVSPILQFLETFLNTCKDVEIDKNKLVIISPDEGATHRAIQLSAIMEVNMGMFYKQRDFSKVVDGRNPIIAHEYIGPDVEGKDVIIIDDMISSGDSLLDVCRQTKERGAKNVYAFSTFGLFTHGFNEIDKAYNEGIISRIFTTNLIYQTPELLSKEYYTTVHLEEYIAAIVDTLHHRESISKLINPYEKCKELIKMYKK